MASRAQGKDTRERLLHAATESFANKGFRGTSLNSVADAGGVTRQGLLHYFPSKTDLLIAVLDQHDQDNERAALESAETTAGDPAASLLAALQPSRERTGIARLLTASAAESAQPDHPAYGYFRRRHEHGRELIAAGVIQGQADGRIDQDVDPEALAVALLAMIDGLKIHLLFDPDLDVSTAVAWFMRALANRDADSANAASGGAASDG